MPILRPVFPDVLTNGVPIAAVQAEPREVERWVQYVCDTTGYQLDWKFRWGVPHIMYLGTDRDRYGALRALEQYAHRLKGTLSTPVTAPLKDSALALRKL